MLCHPRHCDITCRSQSLILLHLPLVTQVFSIGSTQPQYLYYEPISCLLVRKWKTTLAANHSLKRIECYTCTIGVPVSNLIVDVPARYNVRIYLVGVLVICQPVHVLSLPVFVLLVTAVSNDVRQNTEERQFLLERLQTLLYIQTHAKLTTGLSARTL